MPVRKRSERGLSSPSKDDSNRKKWKGEANTELNLQSIPLAPRQINDEEDVKFDVKVCRRVGFPLGRVTVPFHHGTMLWPQSTFQGQWRIYHPGRSNHHKPAGYNRRGFARLTTFNVSNWPHHFEAHYTGYDGLVHVRVTGPAGSDLHVHNVFGTAFPYDKVTREIFQRLNLSGFPIEPRNTYTVSLAHYGRDYFEICLEIEVRFNPSLRDKALRDLYAIHDVDDRRERSQSSSRPSLANVGTSSIIAPLDNECGSRPDTNSDRGDSVSHPNYSRDLCQKSTAIKVEECRRKLLTLENELCTTSALIKDTSAELEDSSDSVDMPGAWVSRAEREIMREILDEASGRKKELVAGIMRFQNALIISERNTALSQREQAIRAHQSPPLRY